MSLLALTASLVWGALPAQFPPQNPGTLFWTEGPELTSKDPEYADFFGESIALWGDTLLVSEPNDSPKGAVGGSVQVFVHDGISWVFEAKLVTKDPSSVGFGMALGLYGDIAVIGDKSGAAYVFERADSKWAETARLRPEYFYTHVSKNHTPTVCVGDGVIAIGTQIDIPPQSSNESSVHVFTRVGGKWLNQGQVYPDDESLDDRFGGCLAIHGTTLMVGARNDDDQGQYSGAVYVFEWTGGGWVSTQKLLASNGGPNSFFGEQVALFEDVAIISARSKYKFPGQPLPPSNAPFPEGAAYIFERVGSDPGTWDETAVLWSEDFNGSEHFGLQVAAFRNRVLASAPASRGFDVGQVVGMAFDTDAGVLYGADATNNQLVVINTTSGAGIPVGPFGLQGMGDLAYDSASNRLLGVDTSSDTVVEIDVTTGAATPLGSPVGVGFDPFGLACDPATGELFAGDRQSGLLLKVDKDTGVGSVVGSFGFNPSNTVMGLAFDPMTGDLMGIRKPKPQSTKWRLARIDKSTGAAVVFGPNIKGGTLALAGDSSAALWTSRLDQDQLVSIDPATASSTTLGSHSTYVPNVGAVYVYDRTGASGQAWDMSARLSASGPPTSTGMGLDGIEVWDDRVLVGAHLDSTAASLAGAVYEFRLDSLPTSYCTSGTSASGCQAVLAATGSPSASALSGFYVSATGLEAQKSGVLFFGSNGRQVVPWGSGSSFQCVVPPVVRAGIASGSGTVGACDGSMSQDLNLLWNQSYGPKPGSNPGAGATVQAQLWYRDPASTSNQTSSLSNALEFVVGP